jgi:F0F1-type ATP synthase membrane subunit a
MHQFMIQKIVELPSITVPGLGAIDLSITNSIAAMLLSAFLIITFYAFAGKGAVVPGRLQTVGEMLYGIADGLTSRSSATTARSTCPSSSPCSPSCCSPTCKACCSAGPATSWASPRPRSWP